MRRKRRLVFGRAILLIGVLLGGCSKAPEETSPLPAANQPGSGEGKAIFQTRCFVCHGREGKGDGPAATGLGATVRDLTSAAWQQSITDETIRSVIRNGAQAVGGSPAMPPNPDLSANQIQSLARYIRELRK